VVWRTRVSSGASLGTRGDEAGLLYSGGCHGRESRCTGTFPDFTKANVSRSVPLRLIIRPRSVSPSTSTRTDPCSTIVRRMIGLVPLRPSLAPALPVTT
jgi:hypothetical protein